MSTSDSNNNDYGSLDLVRNPLWKHVKLLGKNRTNCGGNRKWKCNYCNKESTASYSRVEGHLLQIKCLGITSCPKVTPEILRELKHEVAVAKLEVSKKDELHNQKSAYITLPSGSDLVQPKKRKGTLEKSFNMLQRDEIDKEIARMFYSAALPFNFARNPYWRSVCYKLSTYNVVEYRPPSFDRLRTTLLAQEYTHIDQLLQPVKETWVRRGVSVCSDGWSDGSNKPIINIMASSGTTSAVFVTAVDASGIKKDAPYIASIFIEAIKEIGSQHIVQIVTDNGSNFKAAGAIIEKEYPTIFWTSCVVHCVNLTFRSMCDPSEKSDHFEHCKWIVELCDELNEIQKFVSGHDMVKALFMRYSKILVLRVAETRFASHYVVAERLAMVKTALAKMVIDPEWRMLFKSRNNPLDIKAGKVKSLILDDLWWDKVDYFLKFTKPIYEMIRIGDKDGPILHRIYDMWDCMIEEVKIAIFTKEEKNINTDTSTFFDAIQQILEARWNKSNTPIHCLAHSLVPKYYSEKWLNGGGTLYPRVAPHQDNEVSHQRNICLQRLFPKTVDFKDVLKEFGSFSSGIDAFENPHVIAARDDEDPISWWANYGSSAPHLQSLAIKLLSQPASSSCCERNFSQYKNIQTVKRNRLTTTRAKELVKVHTNLRLLSRQDDSYKHGPSKFWDIGGDHYDVDADLNDLADLSINDPEFEGLFNEDDGEEFE